MRRQKQQQRRPQVGATLMPPVHHKLSRRQLHLENSMAMTQATGLTHRVCHLAWRACSHFPHTHLEV